MKIEIEMTPKEAREIVGKAIHGRFGSSIEGLEVESVDWNRYGTTVTVTLQTPETAEAAPGE